MKYFAELDENNLVISTVYIGPEDSLDSIEISQTHRWLEYSVDNSITKNSAYIEYTYDQELNAFIPPKPNPTYILNKKTFEWEPDGRVKYDLHGDGKLYRFDKKSKGWIPTWDPN